MLEAVLLGLVAVLGLCEYLVGSNMLERPIIMGPVVGLILGDLEQGIIIGGTLELAFMGVMYVGGAVSINTLVGGVVGTALAIMTGNGVEVATTLAIPVGILYNLAEKAYYIANLYFLRKADKGASQGNYKQIERAHYLCFGLWSLFTFVVVTLSIYVGSSAIQAIVDQIPQIVMDGLMAGTTLLPALGFGLLLNLIWNKQIGAFYFIGFVLAAYLEMDVLGIAILGGSIAVLVYFFTKEKTDTGNEVSYEEQSERSSVLTKRDLHRIFFRSFTLEASFNYERFQGLGYCYSMIPALKKLYTDPKELSEALQRHMVFFNTSPQLVTWILGMSVAMEEEYAQTHNYDAEAINSVKVAFMGPLAGVGDSFWWGIVRTIAAGVACQLALAGNILAPFVFIIIFNIPHVLLRYIGMTMSYKFGKSFISKISSENLLQKLSLCAGIMGLMVIGGMSVSMVSVTTPLTIAIEGIDPMQVQELLDTIMPGMLSLLTVFLVVWLLKKNVKVIHLMLILLLIGVLGTMIGIL